MPGQGDLPQGEWLWSPRRGLDVPCATWLSSTFAFLERLLHADFSAFGDLYAGKRRELRH
jgi:hypothetical protein